MIVAAKATMTTKRTVVEMGILGHHVGRFMIATT
jgi:hypothetical protein